VTSHSAVTHAALTIASVAVACSFESSPRASETFGARREGTAGSGGNSVSDSITRTAAGSSAVPVGGTPAEAARSDAATTPPPVEPVQPPVDTVQEDPCGGLCPDDSPFCDPQTQQCVACFSHADCSDPVVPQCENGRCVPCASADACAGRGGATVCDVRIGTCVQCTTADDGPCGGTVCDPEARICTDRPLGSKDTCEACIADSECVADHGCIAMEYAGEPLPGGACLRRATTGCERPYAMGQIERASRSGAAPEVYCGVDEQTTTCAAIAALIAGDACEEGEDAECGAQGALCRTVEGVDDRCSYACSVSASCPVGFQCEGGYCGGGSRGGGNMRE
jgi:hypothetical protein